MNYANDHIRNVLIAGHGGAGKTSLAEALLFTAKSTDRLGRVEDGNTVCDYDPEEAKRRASLSLAVAPVEYDGVKINLIDTPGLFDFELGLHEGIRAAESVLITVSGRSGLTVGAQKAYKLALKHGKSRMIYISKIDAEHADFYKVFEELKAEFGPSICPVVVPIEQAGGRVFVNLIESKAYSYVNGTAREVPMPKYGHREDGLIEAMREVLRVADTQNVDLSEADISYWLDLLATLNPDGHTSMCQDVLAGRPTEIGRASCRERGDLGGRRII